MDMDVQCNFQPLARDCQNVKVTSVKEKKKHYLRLGQARASCVVSQSVSVLCVCTHVLLIYPGVAN